MQTQKELVSLHPDGGILNIDVLSFQRLAYRVFEETGTPVGKVLEAVSYTHLQIALDGIAVIVNNENPVENLTSEQVQSIYTGATTAWADVQ